MALRLRRGTDAQRQTLDGVSLPVPAEGELIYTTDTKKLYVGDGSTAGGIAVDVANSDLSIDALSDVDITSVAPTGGQSLVWNAVDGEFQPGDPTVLDNKSLNDLQDVDLASNPPGVGQVLKWNGSAFVPNDDDAQGGLVTGATYTINIAGDVRGSVFADDSTTVIDGTDGRVLGNVENQTVTTQDVNSAILRLSGLDSTGVNKAGIEIITDGNADDNYALFNIEAATESDVGSSFIFTKSRGTPSARTAVIDGDEILGFNYFGYDSNNAAQPAAVIQVSVDGTPSAGVVPGSIILGTTNPTLGTLPGITVNAQQHTIFGGAAQLVSYADGTARDAAIPSPTAGMMVFLTGTSKAQVNTDGTTGGWVDLH